MLDPSSLADSCSSRVFVMIWTLSHENMFSCLQFSWSAHFGLSNFKQQRWYLIVEGPEDDCSMNFVFSMRHRVRFESNDFREDQKWTNPEISVFN